jgi:phosphatidate phosphatase APP1
VHARDGDSLKAREGVDKRIEFDSKDSREANITQLNTQRESFITDIQDDLRRTTARERSREKERQGEAKRERFTSGFPAHFNSISNLKQLSSLGQCLMPTITGAIVPKVILEKSSEVR